jgi:hypothetical protein
MRSNARAAVGILGMLALLCLLQLAPSHSAPEEDPLEGPIFDAAHRNLAIAKALRWLEKKQGSDGSFGSVQGWGPYGGGVIATNPKSAAGPTALVLYALLRAGRPLKDPVVKRALAFLRKEARMPSVSYSVSVLLLALTATAQRKAGSHPASRWTLPKGYRKWANQLATNLVERRTARGWRYNQAGQMESEAAGGPQDMSSTTFAMLALLSAERCGIDIKREVWSEALGYCLDQQEHAGPEHTFSHPLTKKPLRRPARGFAYILGLASPAAGLPSGSMTAGGCLDLELARYALTEGGRKPMEMFGHRSAEQVQDRLYSGLAWLDLGWDPARNPGAGGEAKDHMCWLFLLGSAMDVLGLERLGEHDWYRAMGQRLLEGQQPSGHWDTESSADPSDTLDTAFALLFLSRHARGLIPYPCVTGGSTTPPPASK